MSQKSSVPQAFSFVSQVLKRHSTVRLGRTRQNMRNAIDDRAPKPSGVVSQNSLRGWQKNERQTQNGQDAKS